MNLQEDINRIKEVMEQTSLELKGKTIAPKYAPPANFGQSSGKKKDPSIDELVNLISIAADLIPGIGNLISAGIDEIHAITYFVRASKTSGIERTELIIHGLITALIGFFPVGGNLLAMGIKPGIKNILRQTPDSIQRWAISKGIINPRILFGKTDFKYPWWLIPIKFFRQKGIDFTVKQLESLRKPLIKFKSYLVDKNLLTPQLSEVFDEAISMLEVSSQQIDVANEMVDKGF
jgi:hypothetical protein